MSVDGWIQSWFEDRAAFASVGLKLPDVEAEELRSAVDLVLSELSSVSEWHTSERVAAVRGAPVPEPDLLSASRVGEALRLLVAKAVTDQRVDRDLFGDLAALTIQQVAGLKRYHGHILTALMAVHYVEKQGMQIRTLSEAEGDAMLGVVADAVYRWPVWVFDDAQWAHAESRRPVIDKVQGLIDLGMLDLRMLGAHAAKAPRAPTPQATPRGVPRTTSYTAGGIPLAPPPPPPPPKEAE